MIERCLLLSIYIGGIIMISKIKSVVDEFLWMDDDSQEDKDSFYKFGITVNVVSVALFLMIVIS